MVTIDYRGFGLSTGFPTEEGVIEDGCSLLRWVLDVAKISPERVVILGQSMGTAVASAVALAYANPSHQLVQARSPKLLNMQTQSETEVTPPRVFAGVVLTAPFSSMPSLLLTYRIGGILPILAPLRPFPYVADMLLSTFLDKWLTAERLKAYVNALTDSPVLHYQTQDEDFTIGDGRSRKTAKEMGTLQLLHAINDAEISFRQSEIIFQRAFNISDPIAIGGKTGKNINVKAEGKPRVSLQILEHGGTSCIYKLLESGNVLTQPLCRT